MITAAMFHRATGHQPRQDDLERANCPKAGQIGHWQCGWNEKRNLPFFMTGDLNRNQAGAEPTTDTE